MEISNQKRSQKIKRGFNLGVVLLLLPILLFVWQEMDLFALINGGLLIIYIIVFQIVGLDYVQYESTNEMIKVRYYPIISFFGKEYNSIEFRKVLLHKAEVKKTFLFSDLFLEVKTKRGVAEYPSVSLAAMSKKDTAAIKADLSQYLKEK
ncbi:hypothetical protein [uncultured Sunxiuqinia sp.]|uniref:hypothetical protein n=1 Tax=uncultured Sunxiuqinia sp. TaxID=1573825 RepID=UPI002AA7E66F|nr:hypothetical protein [uncultured Sunxiuqinia sp.]